MYVIRALLAALGGLFGVGLVFGAGMASERWRPAGSDHHRRTANELAAQLAGMNARHCCHD